MAKKTTTTVVEEASDYDKLHSTPIEEIAKEEPEPPAPPAEETPAEPPAPPKEPEPTDEDVDKAVDELAGEVHQKALEKIIQSLKGDEPAPDDSKPIWEKENRQPTTAEITEYAADLAEKRLAQKEQAKQAEADQATKTQEEEKQRWNTFWDNQLDSLRKEGKLPPITNADDKEDPGVKAAFELQSAALKANELNLELAYYKYYNKSAQPPGADAPISGAKKSVEQSDSGTYTYEEIHNARSMRDLVGER